MTKLVVAAVNNFIDVDHLEKEIQCIIRNYNISEKDGIEIITGGCKQSDEMIARYAACKGYPCKMYPLTAWGSCRQNAYLRAGTIAMYASGRDKGKGHLLAFWDKRNIYVKMMITQAGKYGLNIKVIYL